jgi:hypothetical protein
MAASVLFTLFQANQLDVLDMVVQLLGRHSCAELLRILAMPPVVEKIDNERKTLGDQVSSLPVAEASFAVANRKLFVLSIRICICSVPNFPARCASSAGCSWRHRHRVESECVEHKLII